MWSLPKRIMGYAEVLLEATPLCPGALLHLGHRAAIDQALTALSALWGETIVPSASLPASTGVFTSDRP